MKMKFPLTISSNRAGVIEFRARQGFDVFLIGRRLDKGEKVNLNVCINGFFGNINLKKNSSRLIISRFPVKDMLRYMDIELKPCEPITIIADVEKVLVDNIEPVTVIADIEKVMVDDIEPVHMQ